MKKKLFVFSVCTCLAVVSITGCSVIDNLKNAVTNTEESETAQENDSPYIADAASYIELADYTTIELEAEEIDEELQDNIEETLDEYASYKTVKKGKVKDGDTVNIYYVGKVDGEAFDGGSYTEDTNPEGYDLEIGSDSFIDGFEDALIGKKVGKTYDIDVTFPETYSANSDLAGKDAVFTVTINSKKIKKDQKFTDAFVKKNLSDYESVEDYKTQNRASIVRTNAITKVIDDTTVNDYPEDSLKAMETQLKTSVEYYLSQSSMTLDDYLENLGKTEEEYEEQVTETAKENLASRLVYNAIAQAEEIEISDDEYQEELESYLSDYGCETESDLDSTFQETYGTTAKQVICDNLLYSKVADYLVDNVKES